MARIWWEKPSRQGPLYIHPIFLRLFKQNDVGSRRNDRPTALRIRDARLSAAFAFLVGSPWVPSVSNGSGNGTGADSARPSRFHADGSFRFIVFRTKSIVSQKRLSRDHCSVNLESFFLTLNASIYQLKFSWNMLDFFLQQQVQYYLHSWMVVVKIMTSHFQFFFTNTVLLLLY